MRITENPNTGYRVAVYGSLKAGRHNHGYLKTARFIGRFRTPPEYTMIDLGPYPAVIPEGHTAIEVEIYEVGSDTLKSLDELEEHPESYRRTLIKIANMEVFIYLLTRKGLRDVQKLRCPIIESGRW